MKKRIVLFLIACMHIALLANQANSDSVVSDKKHFKSISTISKDTSSQDSLHTTPTAVIITLEEMVDPGMADYVERAIKQAESQNPDYIIFEVNTFGGRLDAAFDIVDAITAINESITTIAFVNKKAISAGALISFASNQLYMKPTTTIGDCAPVIQGQQGPVVMGEKIQSPLRAKFRNLAERNGYPSLLSQAMVSSDLEILKVTKGDSTQFLLKHEWEEMPDSSKTGWLRKTIVREGELLTLTNTEAEEYGFSRGTIKDIDSLIAHLNITKLDPIEINWAEKLARFIGALAPILMLIGFGALYMEIKTPGFGIFGIIGIIAIGIVFLGQYVTGLADHIGLILIVTGTILILVEIVLIPGTFISGIAGVLCFIIALALSAKAGDITAPEITKGRIDIFLSNINQIMLLAIGALIFPVVVSKYIFPRIPSTMGVMINETLEDAHARTAEESNINITIGAEGTAKTDLRPTGKASFDNIQVEVLAQNGFIEKGTLIKVLAIEGQKITVKRIG